MKYAVIKFSDFKNEHLYNFFKLNLCCLIFCFMFVIPAAIIVFL